MPKKTSLVEALTHPESFTELLMAISSDDIPPSKAERLSPKHEVRTHADNRKCLIEAANS